MLKSDRKITFTVWWRVTESTDNSAAATADVGKVILVIGNKHESRMCRKAKVVSHIRGKDGIVRGVKMLYKGHHIETLLQLVCSLNLKRPLEFDEGSQPNNLSSPKYLRSHWPRNVRNCLILQRFSVSVAPYSTLHIGNFRTLRILICAGHGTACPTRRVPKTHSNTLSLDPIKK